MKKLPTKVKNKRGASLIEVIVGLFLIVPLFLAIIDLSCIVLGQITNDSLAKRVARAAAQQPNAAGAANTANSMIAAFQPNGIVTLPQLINLTYNSGNSGFVVVETKVRITIPAPVPFVPLLQQSRDMHARATETIVVLPANP